MESLLIKNTLERMLISHSITYPYGFIHMFYLQIIFDLYLVDFRTPTVCKMSSNFN